MTKNDKNTVPAPAQRDPSQSKKNEGEKGLATWVRNLLPFHKKNKEDQDDSLLEAIEELIEEEDDDGDHSAVASHERRLITNILKLRDLSVVDVMVPRADVVAIDISAPKEELFELLAQKPHSRIPVYKGDLDNIVGIINMKDLVITLANNMTFEMKDVVRETLFVSPAMRVMDLMLQMRQSRVHVAFIVDEFGGVDGLITINDLIEAVVGQIDDEFDFSITPQLIERPDGSIIADGRYPISEFESKYSNVFSEDEEHDEIDTLGGLVAHLAGHVPSRGEVARHEASGIEFDVIDADPRRVIRVRLRNMPKKEEKTE